MRRTTYVLIWLAVTTTAVFIAAAAVGSVRDQVTERPTAMIPTTATTIPPAAASDSATAAEPAPPTTLPPTTLPPTTTVSTTTIAATTTTSPDASTTTSQPPAPTTTTTTSTTTTTAPPPTEIRSYDLVGGSVTVEVGSGTVLLAGASPKAGFDMDVEDAGPEKVEVEFKSDQHESHFSAEFESGVFKPEIEESGQDGDDD